MRCQLEQTRLSANVSLFHETESENNKRLCFLLTSAVAPITQMDSFNAFDEKETAHAHRVIIQPLINMLINATLALYHLL